MGAARMTAVASLLAIGIRLGCPSRLMLNAFGSRVFMLKGEGAYIERQSWEEPAGVSARDLFRSSWQASPPGLR